MPAAMTLRDAIAEVAQLKAEGAAERQAAFDTQKDIRRTILLNPVAQAMGAGAQLPPELPPPPTTPSGQSGGQSSVDKEVEEYRRKHRLLK